MATQYRCRQKRRLEAVREHATLNGIDYLEVLDLEAPAGSPRQQTLFIQLVKPLDAGVTFSASNVAIDGGVRVGPIQVAWADRASNADTMLADGLISSAEHDLFLQRDQPDAGDLLVVRTKESGDYSTYRLRLVDGDTTLATLDPPLAEVEFSFKVECPSDFDCAPQQVCPPEPRPAPPIDYLARDYESYRRLMLDRLSVVMPGWKERSPADVGVALVEVLAYAADRLSYRQDAVATEAYLGTARRRPSVHRHARLLDYPMHDGVNARAWVAFLAAAGVADVVLPREYLPGRPTRLLTRVPGFPALLDEKTFGTLVAEHRPQVFELLHDLPLYAVHNRLRFYTWGDDDCCLPAGATRATLRDNASARLRLRAGDVLVFEEVKGPGTGQAADADPAHRHAVRLTRVSPAATEDDHGVRTPGSPSTDALFDQPIVEIEWGPEDALPFPLCLSVVVTDEEGKETLVRDVSVARGNVALADHGRTMPLETLAEPTGRADYRPWLKEPGVTQAVPFDATAWAATPPGDAGWLSAAAARVQDPRRALPDATLTDAQSGTWRPERDLLASDRFDPDFVAEAEDDGRVRLRFGDNIYGLRPEAGVALEATYRTGSGPGGNVGAGAIFHLLTTPGLGIDTSTDVPGIRNPLPAVGGTSPEPLDDVRQYAPQAFRRPERAVTEADYGMVAGWHPEVSRAVARRRWTGSWHTMFVTIDRVAGRPVDDPFEAELRAWIDRYKLAGHDVEIEPPRFVSLDIAMTVCVKAGYLRSDVKAALLDVFSRFDLPDGRRGYFHPDNFTFGQSVYLSRIIATAMKVPGVRWVKIDPTSDPPGRFQRWGEAARGEIDAGLIRIGRLEIARLDNDPNAQENGKLVFNMEGGL